ncbi:GlxA family transcriptional regulator [Aestuariispira insulae]|uniref:Transcriptional regulator GlxA family with amidase domain n=1 Tax=Aestuariispira insulae TaxID=1461337 RepID=A0A3D9H5R0_9PROT|nr:GlxA family transcriptional regulator [Aestuariispira insulae]RED44828.1 transcriptional regulator GlxA family with amidase domain [Aestuariispira insulae]
MVIVNKHREESGAQGRKRVGILMLPHFQGSVLQGILDPIVWVNKLFNRYEYKTALISFNGSAVTSWHGFDTPVQYSIWDAPKLDSLIVIGESNLTHYSQAQLQSWLRFLGRQDIRIGAIGYAVMTLAEAGLYNGHKCTAHWSQHASVVERFEEVDVVPDLFVFDRNRFSCAGGVATFDLMLSIIREDLDSDIARRCANFFNHDRIRSGSEPQRLPHNVTASYPNVKIQRAINIINEEIGNPPTLTELSKRVGVSRRHLERLFAKHLGKTLRNYVVETQLWRAYDLLVNTSMSITQISYATGFSSASLFSKHFKMMYGQSPSKMREDSIIG